MKFITLYERPSQRMGLNPRQPTPPARQRAIRHLLVTADDEVALDRQYHKRLGDIVDLPADSYFALDAIPCTACDQAAAILAKNSTE